MVEVCPDMFKFIIRYVASDLETAEVRIDTRVGASAFISHTLFREFGSERDVRGHDFDARRKVSLNLFLRKLSFTVLILGFLYLFFSLLKVSINMLGF